MSTLSLAFLTVPDADPITAIKVAEQVGFDHLGVRLIPAVAGEGPYPLLSDRSALGLAKEMLADVRVSVNDVELIRILPETEVSSFLRFFEVAAELGAENVTVINDDPLIARASATFARLAETAAQCGLTLNLEPMAWTATTSLASALAIITASEAENAAVLVDVFHCSRCGITKEELLALPDHRVRMLQICDAPASYRPEAWAIREEARTARLMPGEGELDIAGIAQSLQKHLCISVEVPNNKLLSQLSPLARAEMALAAARGVLHGTLQIAESCDAKS